MTEFRIQRAVKALRAGGVIAYPTEAVWGLGCDPHNLSALLTLLELKQRELEKGVILVAADIAQFEPLLHDITATQRQQLEDSWPGPNTWLVPTTAAPAWITGGRDTIALRVSDHPVVQKLCRAFGGPIVSTSANPSGQRPAVSRLDIERYFHCSSHSLRHNQNSFAAGHVTVVPGNLGGLKRPTTIRELCSGAVLRD